MTPRQGETRSQYNRRSNAYNRERLRRKELGLPSVFQERRCSIPPPEPRECPICGTDITNRRSDAKTCSSACRYYLSRDQRRADSRRYYQDHIEERRQKAREYRMSNPDKVKNARARSKAKHRDEYIARSRARYDPSKRRDEYFKNHEYHLARHASYRAKHRQELIEKNREYRRRNPEIMLAGEKHRLSKLPDELVPIASLVLETRRALGIGRRRLND